MSRLDLPTAQRLASSMRDRLAPFCDRLEIAGSIRRQTATVKDVELVAIPRWGDGPPDPGQLFPTRVNLLQREIESMADGERLMVIKPSVPGIVPWQLNPTGRYWRLYMPELELKVDVFLPNVDTWGLILTIRTGSGVGPDGQPFTGFGPALLRRWKQISPGGFSDKGQLRHADGSPVPTPEEADVFDVLRMNFVPPHRRRSHEDAAAAFRR